MSVSRVIPLDDGRDVVTRRIQIELPTEQRLDRFLAERLSLSRSHVAALIEAGRVRIGSRLPKKSYTPEPGDEIVVEIPAPTPPDVEPEDVPLDVLYEDEGFLVVNKPAGMVVHPGPGHARGTLVNALLHHTDRLSAIGGARRPGIVHRLDKDTSGLIIVAKQEVVHRRLADALSRRKISRQYLAAAWGHIEGDSLLIQADVGRHQRDRKRMAVVPGARPATTEVWRLERWKAADFLKIRLHTGRTHQIRVHLLHIGHPVVGDRQYGCGWERGLSATAGRWAKQLAERVARQFLHAAELRFAHPVSGRVMEFSAPLPPELASAADWARKTS